MLYVLTATGKGLTPEQIEEDKYAGEVFMDTCEPSKLE